MTLRIYGYSGSINVRKVLWLCEELGLDYTREDWGSSYRSLSDPEFRALNPVGLVPVIDRDGVIVWESNVILRYLASAEGRNDLLPKDPARRAHIEMWMDWQGSDFNNSWRVAFQGLVRKNPEHQDRDAIARSIADFSRLITIVDSCLKNSGGFITGAQFTLADIPMGLSIHRWKSIPGERPQLPNVEHYYDRLCERLGFRKFARDGGP
jgi:glutathione S-transferase